jgi:hypothetical protein
MITISLAQIKSHNPCESGWETLLASKGGDSADMELPFPFDDIITSNGVDDALWALQCLPEHNKLWRKLAVSYARDVKHLMKDNRSINALDVAWRHSEGKATDSELYAAWVAAGDARDAAHAAALAARDAALAAAGDVRYARYAAMWAAMWAAHSAAGAASRDVRHAAHVAALAARDAASRDARYAAHVAALAAGADWALDWDAARQKQQERLVAILTAGQWVGVGNE